MSLKKTLVLALLLIGAAVYIFKIEIPQGEAKKTEKNIFRGVTKSQFEKIEVSGKQGSYILVNTKPVAEPVSAQSSDPAADALAGWELGDLKGAELDRGSLNSLLSALVGFREEISIPKDEQESDLTIYGLKDPELLLKAWHSGQELAISFGKNNSYLSKRYASINGQAGIFLVSDALFTAANKSRTEMRNHTPVGFADSEISELLLNFDGQKLKFLAHSDGQWKIAEPFAASASSTAVSNLLMQLRNLRAEDFIDPPGDRAAEYGLEKPQLEIDLNFKDSTKRAPLHLGIGSASAPQGQQAQFRWFMNLSGKPSIFKLSADPLSALNRDAGFYREKKLFQVISDQVQKVNCSAPALSLTKNGEHWEVNGKPGDDVFVKEALQRFSNLEAESFPNQEQDFGFNSPTLRCQFTLKSGAKPELVRTLVVGKRLDDKQNMGRYFAAVDDLSEPFIISEQSLAGITPREEALLKPINTPAPLLTPAAAP
ncbi:MAG: DUF4340 domain-containing protein [Oligoflexia bacterium]|nr:DUF4340 domain-containing protein [Oligoflexia bacterium]